MSKLRMRQSFRVIAGVLIAGSVLLTACSPLPDANPAATVATKEVSSVVATPVATAATTEVSPTAATPQATPRATAATPEVAPVAATPVSTPDDAVMDLATSTVASPDGRWVAELTVATPKNGDSYYTNLTITNAAKTSRWTAVDAWAPYGLGYTVPRPFHWSRDGRYLYVTNDPAPDGCALFVNGSDLQRVDLSDGSVTEIVGPVGLWLSLSPDETKLAYLSWNGDRPLVVRDLASGAENAIKLPAGDPNWQAGNIVWSPDGNSMVLTVANNPCAGGWAQSTSIMQVNLATLQARPLLADDKRLLVTAEWPEPSTIVLQDQNGQQVKMNAATGQIEQNAATGALQGHVNIGPLQPVVRIDEPTPVVPPEAYAARQIVIYAADGQTEIARVQIGPDGNYKVALPPGPYVVDLTRSGIDRSNLPVKIQIAAGQTTTLDVEIDTGIR